MSNTTATVLHENPKTESKRWMRNTLTSAAPCHGWLLPPFFLDSQGFFGWKNLAQKHQESGSPISAFCKVMISASFFWGGRSFIKGWTTYGDPTSSAVLAQGLSTSCFETAKKPGDMSNFHRNPFHALLLGQILRGNNTINIPTYKGWNSNLIPSGFGCFQKSWYPQIIH